MINVLIIMVIVLYAIGILASLAGAVLRLVLWLRGEY